MKVIFISGKYRSCSGEYYVRKNIRFAEEQALYVWKHGGIALCPHKNTAGFGGALGITDDVWLAGDLELLKRCDAIWMIKGWLSSEGACAEKVFAENNGIRVLMSIEDVKRFLQHES